MSYQVIARKYRPQRFSDVVGQDHVAQTLTNAIEQNRIAHAYLFVGPRGTGKTTIARIFAKCLNSTDGPRVDFPDDDPRCQEIAEGRSLDVLEIDGASNRGIEEVRELRETVKYAPANGLYKIYIIDEVHMLTKEAFNALLKTLEEPPEHVKFMFATTEPEKVLPTILSRCQRFDLRRIPVQLIVQHLAGIAKLEKVTAEEAALHAIARGADGGMRDAESALDQLISFCGNTIVESDVLSMFGLTAQAQLFALSEAILQGAAEAVLRELNRLAKQGKDLGRLLGDLLNHFRNLLIFSISKGDLALLEASETEAATLSRQAQLATEDTLTRIMEVLSDAEGKLRDAASKKIFMEVTLLKALQARNAVSVDSLLSQLKSLGEAGTTPAASASAAAPAKRPATARGAAAPPAPQAAPITAAEPAPPAQASPASSTPEATWNTLLDAVGQASAFAKSYLSHGHWVSFADRILTIGFDPQVEHQRDFVDNPKTRALIAEKLAVLGHADVTVRFVIAPSPHPVPAAFEEPEPEPVPAPRPAAASPKAEHATPARQEPPPAANTPPPAVELSAEDFKNDPLIKRALELFKGQIVQVRT